jgi:hypothetical protein
MKFEAAIKSLQKGKVQDSSSPSTERKDGTTRN